MSPKAHALFFGDQYVRRIHVCKFSHSEIQGCIICVQIFLPATSLGLVDTAHYFCRVIIAILASASASLLTAGAAYSPSIAADGVVKLNHISKCGRACKKQEPLRHSCYWEPNATVTERAAEACLNLASCMQVNPGEDGDDNGYDIDEDADDNTGCSASVTCARISCVAKAFVMCTVLSEQYAPTLSQ